MNLSAWITHVALITDQTRDEVLKAFEHIEPIFRSGVSPNDVARQWGNWDDLQHQSKSKKCTLK